jgi:homer
LFTCKAHVFQLEPELKKSWIALSTTAVNVQIFHDPIKTIYRIVSIEGTKALINSIVTPKMTFTKTSQKFGQWIDFKLNLVYGLGFANDVELNKFVDKFKEIKELTRTHHTMKPHERSNSCELSQSNRMVIIIITISQFVNLFHFFLNKQKKSIENCNSKTNENSDINLKAENERLKLALAQSSINSRKWEEELTALKTNNSRLTTALQESHSHVDEWKNQLKFYKDECSRLKISSASKISNNDHFDEVSSSTTSIDKSTKSNIVSNKKIKVEITKLSENFDKKLKELNDIREQLHKLVAELN